MDPLKGLCKSGHKRVCTKAVEESGEIFREPPVNGSENSRKIHGSLRRIRLVFSNLITNAIDALISAGRSLQKLVSSSGIQFGITAYRPHRNGLRMSHKIVFETGLADSVRSPRTRITENHSAFRFNRFARGFKLMLLERVLRLPWSLHRSRHLIFD